MGCWRISACSGVKGTEERPWKERAQSTWVWEGSRGAAASEKPSVRERSSGSCVAEVALDAVGGVVVAGAEDGEGAGAVADCCCRIRGLEEMGRSCVARRHICRCASLHDGAVRKARRFAPARRDAGAFMMRNGQFEIDGFKVSKSCST